jgi:hypothetical protein
VKHLAKVFECKWEALNVTLAVGVAAVVVALFVVFNALHWEHYWLSATFGLVFMVVGAAGGHSAHRERDLAVLEVVGALLTALAFALGTGAWGFIALAALLVTLAAGLSLRFGLPVFMVAVFLNIWFIVALSLAAGYKTAGVATSSWKQALSWLAGTALLLGIVLVVRLVHRRQPQKAAETPESTKPIQLTRPVVLFAMVRALTVAVAVAIPFGLKVPEAFLMPVATIVALKPSLEQSTLMAEQRVIGTLIGAVLAAGLLLTVADKHVLVAVIVVFVAAMASVIKVNYALFCFGLAVAVLIALDLPHPTNLSDEGRRVLYTFAGVALAVVVTFLLDRLKKRGAKVAPAAS